MCKDPQCKTSALNAFENRKANIRKTNWLSDLWSPVKNSGARVGKGSWWESFAVEDSNWFYHFSWFSQSHSEPWLLICLFSEVSFFSACSCFWEPSLAHCQPFLLSPWSWWDVQGLGPSGHLSQPDWKLYIIMVVDQIVQTKYHTTKDNHTFFCLNTCHLERHRQLIKEGVPYRRNHWYNNSLRAILQPIPLHGYNLYPCRYP